MYVRWKRRKMVGKFLPAGPHYALSAVLVESRRVDGKPRQKVIKHLGCIRESAIVYPGHRISFWRTAAAAFKALALPAEQQRTIELVLHARVPFPTNEERGRAQMELEALTNSIKAANV
jgi:hypothetical protein